MVFGVEAHINNLAHLKSMERAPTGIDGLDELIEGGIPRRRMVLVSGSCGTGKTIFSAQYIYRGAVDYDEPGIFVTLDERPSTIREDMLQFGWDLKALEEKGMLRIIDGTVTKVGIPSEEEFSLPETGFNLDKLLVEIIKSIKELGAKRLVVDSLPALGFKYDTEADVRKAILKMSYVLSRTGVTSIVTTEIPENAGVYSKYGVEEFVADGVIVLQYGGLGANATRTLHVRKMRGTKHSEHIHPMEITRERGIVVYPIDEV